MIWCVLRMHVCAFPFFCSVNAREHAVELRRIGPGPPAESYCADAPLPVFSCVWRSCVCVCVEELGLNLSGPPRMKGKRAPLIAAWTQGGSKGRPLRKERQERAGTPGSISGPQCKWAHYRKQTPTAEQTQAWWSPLAIASSWAWTSQTTGHHWVILKLQIAPEHAWPRSAK